MFVKWKHATCSSGKVEAEVNVTKTRVNPTQMLIDALVCLIIYTELSSKC